MIRHGEKPPADGIRLSAAGTWRANHLPGVFGPQSNFNIGYILAEKPNEGLCSRFLVSIWDPNVPPEDGHDERPYLTVLPLANSLELKTADNSFDIRFKRDKSQKVADAVNNFQGPGNILICWEHKALTDLAAAIGVTNPPEYDGTR
jgi:hypothetical protein